MKFFLWFSIGSTLEVTTPFWTTLMEASSFESASVLRSFGFSISSRVYVVAWSFLGEDVRPCGMNEEGHQGSKWPWNGLETMWK